MEPEKIVKKIKILIKRLISHPHFPTGLAFLLLAIFLVTGSYASRPSRGRRLTSSPLLWAKLDGSLSDENSAGSTFAYSVGKSSSGSDYGITLKDGDNIQYSPGSAIDASSDVYENWNPNQGTMNVWVQPSWNGGDNEAHWIWSADAGRIDTDDANLVAYWKFDEGSENFAFDSSSNDNVGYLHGPALSFDGGDYVKRSVVDFRSADSTGSIEAWIKVTSLSTSQYIFSSSDESSDTIYIGLLLRDSNYFTITQRNNDTQDIVTGDTLAEAGKWYHVVVISSGTSYSLYVNGHNESLSIPSGSNSGDWFADTNNRDNFSIGALIRTSIIYSNHIIDDVRIYSRALSATEVGQHYAGTFADESGLVGYWNMDENTGQYAYDSSGNDNTGTLGATSGSSADDPTWVNYAPRWTDAGRFGEALIFDGSDDEVEINDINF